ncbi:MAG: hypothetical protein LBO05_07630 [Deltaproteobacteria bacterium]|jgi:hypothetical protein|nr:hypothetical protein [Deltaproteobacteria bacterium]
MTPGILRPTSAGSSVGLCAGASLGVRRQSPSMGRLRSVISAAKICRPTTVALTSVFSVRHSRTTTGPSLISL